MSCITNTSKMMGFRSWRRLDCLASRLIGRHVGTTVTPAIAAARQTLGGTDPGYIAQQITRMEASVLNDPALAIGTAKELVETCCKTILEARSVIFPRSADLPELMKLTTKELELTPDNIPDKGKAAATVSGY